MTQAQACSLAAPPMTTKSKRDQPHVKKGVNQCAKRLRASSKEKICRQVRANSLAKVSFQTNLMGEVEADRREEHIEFVDRHGISAAGVWPKL